MQPDQTNQINNRRVEWFVFIVACGLWVAAISNRSFWIDEAHSAGWKAMQPTFSAWWHDMVGERTSDAQTPLYLFYVWVFAKVFGLSEWVLRAANLPWLILGFWAWWRAGGPGDGWKWRGALAACSAFLWYYLDEARPYGMQIGSMFLVAAGAQRLYTAPCRLWFALFCLGEITLFGSNLIGGIWAGAALAATAGALGWKRCRYLLRAHWLLFGLTLITLGVFGVYYLWTLEVGARATAVGTTDGKNLPFIFYELAGFSGLGPGRLEIRGNGLRSFRPYFAWLAMYAAILFPVFLAGCLRCWRVIPSRVIGSIVLFFAGALGFLVMVGVSSHFRLLGRHCAPLVVLILYLLGMGMAEWWGRGKWFGKMWVVLFLVLSLASSLSLRFGSRHAKDDYRSAAAVAKRALQQGKVVWWNADAYGAAYYGVATTTNEAPSGAARYFMSLLPGEVSVPPEVIITSRPDVYDPAHVLGDFIARQKFKRTAAFTAFAVWERNPD
jgi:hypothetical protein